jgi:hypothetical protein
VPGRLAGAECLAAACWLEAGEEACRAEACPAAVACQAAGVCPAAVARQAVGVCLAVVACKAAGVFLDAVACKAAGVCPAAVACKAPGWKAKGRRELQALAGPGVAGACLGEAAAARQVEIPAPRAPPQAGPVQAVAVAGPGRRQG